MQLNFKENFSKICRTCLQQIDSNTKSFSLDFTTPSSTLTIRQKLNVYIPEIDLAVAPASRICTECCNTIDSAYKFKQRCLQLEEDISRFLHKTDSSVTFQKVAQTKSSENLDVSGIRIKSEPMQVEENVNIKQEPIDSYDDGYVDMEQENQRIFNFEPDLPHVNHWNPNGNSMCFETRPPTPSLNLNISKKESLGNFIETKPTIQTTTFVHSNTPKSTLSFSFKNPDKLETKPQVKTTSNVNISTLKKTLLAKYKNPDNVETKPQIKTVTDVNKTLFDFRNAIDFETKQQINASNINLSTYRASLANFQNPNFEAKPQINAITNIKSLPNNTLASFVNSTFSDVKPPPNLQNFAPVKKLRFKCELCGFITSCNSSFAEHMQVHSQQIFSKCIEVKHNDFDTNAYSNRTLYRCEMCNYASYRKTLLRIHIRKIHKPEKPFRCAKCPYSSISSTSLEKHMKVHIIKCDICNYSSMHIASIKAHMRTHTGEKPFVCPKCDYRASQKGTLQSHMQTHNNECHLCGFRSKTELRLLDHMVYHAAKPNSQYKCGRKNTPNNGNSCQSDENHDTNENCAADFKIKICANSENVTIQATEQI